VENSILNMENKKESVINITIDGRSVGISYSQANALMNDIKLQMFMSHDHEKDMKLVENRLQEFEEHNRQFPDELFIPNSKRNLK